MLLGKPGGGRRGRPIASCPIRVTIISPRKGTRTIRFRLMPAVAKEARWKKGDHVVPELDPETGAITISRTDKGHWQLTTGSKKDAVPRSYIIRLGLSDEALKALRAFEFPAEIQEYAESEGQIIFELPRKA